MSPDSSAPTPRNPPSPGRPSRWLLALGAVFLLVGASSIAYLVFFAAPSSRAEALSDWEARLGAMANDRRVAIERWARDLRSDAETMAQYPTAVYILSGRSGPPYPFDPDRGARTHLQELLDGFVEVHRFATAAVYDSTAELIVGTNAPGSAGARFGGLVRAVIDDGESRVQLGGGRDARVAVSTPIRDGGGRLRGAALVEVDPAAFLYRLLTQQPAPSRTGETLLVTAEDGQLVYISPLRKAEYVPGALRLSSGAEEVAGAAAAGGATGLGRYLDYEGDEVMAVTQPIAGTDWALVAKVDMDEVLAEYYAELRGVVAAISGLLVGILGLSFGIWRWQSQRFASTVLRERARFAAVLDNANDPIFFFSASGRILDLNQRAEEYYGYSRHRLLGQSAEFLRSETDRARATDHLSAALERGTVMVEAEHQLADGTAVPVEISTRRTTIEGERVLISIVRDIRDRKAAEDALRKTEERYRTLVENLPDLVSRFGPDLRCAFVSSPAADRSPFPVDDPVGRTFREMGLPDDVAAPLHAALRAVFETGESREVEVAIPGEQEDRTFDWRIVPERGPSGAVTSAVSIVRETTERQALAHQLQQSQKMEAVGRLAGGVAHDFNNILTSIQGHAALALEELEPIDPLRSDLEEIVRSAERASSLTRQLLAFSRRQIVRSRAVDVGKIVAGMENMLRRLIGENIALEVRVDGAVSPTIQADPSQIEQVVLNLAVNARDAMPEGGRLRIEVDTTGEPGEPGTVCLRVVDTGVGMDPDTMDRIFEPFYTTKEAGKGTGLGLSTVYGIVEQTGGMIEVESEPGGGTELEIRFPTVGSEPARPDTLEEDALAATEAGAATVLLVEDEDGVRALARRVLEREGHRVFTARSGVEALELAGEVDQELDLLLTDMVMPGMDGRELARRVQAMHPDCQVLLMSGYTEDTVIREQRLDLNTRFIGKPFTPRELIGHVADILTTRSGG